MKLEEESREGEWEGGGWSVGCKVGGWGSNEACSLLQAFRMSWG